MFFVPKNGRHKAASGSHSKALGSLNTIMARPRKENHEKRSERLTTDVTIAQKADVQMRARAAGLSLADYNRNAILGRRMSTNAATSNNALLCELSRIYVSLEQAKKGSATGCDPSLLDPILSQLTDTLEKVALNGS